MLVRYLMFTIMFVSASCHVVMNEHDERIRQIMMEDDDVNEKAGSGDDGNSDLTPDTLTPTLIAAIVISCVVALAALFFFASCAWYKIRGTNQTFIRITHDDLDDGTLCMVDYDELNIHHGQLSIDTSTNIADGTHTRESKS